MNILVLGSEGTIGKPLVNKLEEQDHYVVTGDIVNPINGSNNYCDIKYIESIEHLFTDSIDVCVLLAGLVSRYACETMPALAIDTNIKGTYNVIKNCLEHDIRLVFAGTSEEYGSAYDHYIVDEESDLGDPYNIYGLTKQYAEKLIKYYHIHYYLEATIMRLFMCFGNEDENDFRSAISKFILAARQNKNMFVHEGTSRSWCYIDDIVDGIVSCIMYKDTPYEIFNIGSEENYLLTINLAEMIKGLLNSDSKITYINKPDEIIKEKYASFSKARDILGWESKVDIITGLKKMLGLDK